MKYPTQERLRELFDYDAANGKLIWRRRTGRPAWNAKWYGREAGYIKVSPSDLSIRYIVNVDGYKYNGIKIIWILLNGDIEEGVVIKRKDIFAGFGIENLEIDIGDNKKSRKRAYKSKSKYVGIRKNKEGTYSAGHGGRFFYSEYYAAVEYDNRVEESDGIRPNNTEREDVSKYVVTADIAQHRGKALRSKLKNGLVGVRENKSGRFEVCFGKRYIGTFDTKEQAARAYNIAAREKYGEHAVLNDIPDPLGEGAPI